MADFFLLDLCDGRVDGRLVHEANSMLRNPPSVTSTYLGIPDTRLYMPISRTSHSAYRPSTNTFYVRFSVLPALASSELHLMTVTPALDYNRKLSSTNVTVQRGKLLFSGIRHKARLVPPAQCEPLRLRHTSESVLLSHYISSCTYLHARQGNPVMIEALGAAGGNCQTPYRATTSPTFQVASSTHDSEPPRGFGVR